MIESREIIREIVDELEGMQPDTCGLRKNNMSRTEKLASIKRFVSAIAARDQVDDQTSPTMFVPPLEKGQMVYVNFSGVGGELDRVHFAIVWEVSAKRDCIEILPVKSEKAHYKLYEHAFSIGVVDFFTRETWVDVREVTSISRKRINTTVFESAKGAADFREVYLSVEQEQRIEDAMRVYWGKQRTLLEYIIENNKDSIPALRDYPIQAEHLLRAPKRFKTNPERTLSEYNLYQDPVTYYIDWRTPSTNVRKSDRKREIKNWAYARSEGKRDRYESMQSLSSRNG